MDKILCFRDNFPSFQYCKKIDLATDSQLTLKYMKRARIHPAIFYVLFLAPLLFSCSTKERPLSIVGKWYHISRNGYSELAIDSQYVEAFSEKLGKSKLEYKIEKDSFKYLTIKYSAKILPIGDSVILLRGNDNYEVELKKFNESVEAFEYAPNESDSSKFNLYITKFSDRAYKALLKSGHIRPE